MKWMSLFDSTITDGDPRFLAIKNNNNYTDIRNHIEELWPIFEPYADPDFRQKFPKDFHNHYWEMFLGCALLKLNLTLEPTNGVGPDFKILREGESPLFIEATAVGSGEGDDSVPPISCDDNEVSQPIPFEKIVLRIRSAVREKNKKWRGWVNNGVICQDSPYIIAINVGDIPHATTNTSPPLSAYACLGFGATIGTLDSKGGWQASILPSPTITKVSGNEVETTIFLDISHAHVSGLILSGVNPFWNSIERGTFERGGFEFLHNPYAKSAVPKQWFRFGTEYWVDTDKKTLCSK